MYSGGWISEQLFRLKNLTRILENGQPTNNSNYPTLLLEFIND